MSAEVKPALAGLEQLPPSQAENAYRAIRDRLVMLDIHPGAPINDEQLASSLGLGRTPVREALKRLETERLVVAYPRRGTFATDVNITDLAQISEVRQLLEPLAAGKAALRSTPEDQRALAALLAALESVTDVIGTQALMQLDLEVHRAIYTATHNSHLQDTLTRYGNLATRIWCLFVDRLPRMADHVVEHVSTLQAVLGRDEQAATALAAEHVSSFEREIRALL